MADSVPFALHQPKAKAQDHLLQILLAEKSEPDEPFQDVHHACGM
jgi:hypothetical protein